MNKEFNQQKFEITFNKHKALLKEALNIKEGSPQEFIDQALTNPQIIKDMRDWVKDCQWGDISDESDVDNLTDVEIVKGVDKGFDGGVKGFIQSGDYDKKDSGEYSHSPEMRVRSDEPQFGEVNEEKPDYGDQLRMAYNKVKKQKNAEAMVYYKNIMNSSSVASVPFEKFKGSWAYTQWIEKPEIKKQIADEVAWFKSHPWLEETSESKGDICPACNGSGEGRADGTICRVCKGSGSTIPAGKKTKYNDPDYDWDSDDEERRLGMDEIGGSYGEPVAMGEKILKEGGLSKDAEQLLNYCVKVLGARVVREGSTYKVFLPKEKVKYPQLVSRPWTIHPDKSGADANQFAQYVYKAYGSNRKDLAQAVKDGKPLGETLKEIWQNKLQDEYGSFKEWERWSDIYNLAKRLGFSSNEEAWKANPMISGGVNPSDFKVVNETLKEGTPPNFPDDLKKKIIKQYGKSPKAYATMWALHKKHGEKLSEMWIGMKENFNPDEHERQEWERGISKFNKRNPSRFPCPTCGTKNALSAWEHQKGYQCKACADAEEGNY